MTLAMEYRDRERKTGSYWVKAGFRDGWDIAHWQSDDAGGGDWQLFCSAEARWFSWDFEDIDERMIERSAP